jgi:hypothetical protein
VVISAGPPGYGHEVLPETLATAKTASSPWKNRIPIAPKPSGRAGAREQGPDGLVRITLKKAYNDGTIAMDMDPLSLLCRLATSVPPPRFHTVKYAGVLAPASRWRSRLAPQPPQAATASDEPGRPDHAGGYLPWAVVPKACVDSCSPDFPGRVRGWAGSLPSLLPYRAARTT